ncbi:MAG: hypothetical protein ABSE42_09955 [Bryobacteraceae bacterium]|jgi:hypothetical protein
MLTIRPAQFAVLSQWEVQKFEDRTLVHLQKFFPRQCAALGERRLRESIQYGIRRAANYGITARRDVCKYIDLMIVFGRDFDADKRFRWAGEILRGRGHPGTRMQALIMQAKLRLRKR